MKRPWGFRKFVGKEEFHSLYLITTETNAPMKVGIASDPTQRFAAIQSGHFLTLKLHRAWWVAGRLISKKIEDAFKEHFAPHCIRGEWFDLPLADAEAFIEAAIRDLRTWSAQDRDLVEVMDYRRRRRDAIPNDAPSPVVGAKPWLADT